MSEHITHEYVARITKGNFAGLFLRRTIGCWGPEYVVTDDLMKAARWDTIPLNTHIWSVDDKDIDFTSVKVTLALTIMKD